MTPERFHRWKTLVDLRVVRAGGAAADEFWDMVNAGWATDDIVPGRPGVRDFKITLEGLRAWERSYAGRYEAGFTGGRASPGDSDGDRGAGAGLRPSSRSLPFRNGARWETTSSVRAVDLARGRRLLRERSRRTLVRGRPLLRPATRRIRQLRTSDRFVWTDATIEQLRTLWADETLTTAGIAGVMGAATKNVIIGKAHKLGLPKRKRGPRRDPLRPRRTPGQHDPSNQRRFLALKPRGSRFKFGDDHPPLREGRTLFPTRVFEPSAVPRLLISGHNSRKTGKTVMKGRWAGMPIFTLTLEERKTCPRTCLEWRTCYGNNMQYARRIRHGRPLETALWSEIEALQALNPHGFVLRLHVLGDFYSVGYVDFWARALDAFPALRVFGYTARLPGEPIGAAVLALAASKWDRFAVRLSGGGFSTRCSEVVDAPDEATGIICPAQLDPAGKRSCATCALCWQTERTITFLRH